MADWQPIETIPDNGCFLVFWPGYLLNEDGDLTTERANDDCWLIGAAERLQGEWNGEPDCMNGIGRYFGDDWEYGDPTHWQPLPAPPATAAA